jgi:hypothetical protein
MTCHRHPATAAQVLAAGQGTHMKCDLAGGGEPR